MDRNILIVDDNAINRRMLKAALSKDYEIFEAANGREALDILKSSSKQMSAVLLDIMMPVMDGYQVMGEMKADSELSAIPIIIETASTGEQTEMKALSMGAVDVITKPYNPVLIRKRIDNIVKLREVAALANAAVRDDLTGLYNRKAFFELAETMIAEHEPGYYVMACFDIDNFKVINDQYGVKKGDEVLQYIAGTFSEGFEAQGGICSRVMADNFAVLYPAEFMKSEEIKEIRAKAAIVEGLVSALTFSIGRYVVEDLSLSASAMYDRATLAEASVKGRYDVRIAQYDETMREKLIHSQRLISEMGEALADEQFEVWLQPQYNYSSNALIGAEALVRWNHPQKGLIPPGEFIPVFERNGFIYELDKYVWETSCRYLRKWIDADRKPLALSVNISRYDIFRDDFMDVITGIVKKYNIPVDLLRLEITESAFAESTKQIVKIVKRLIDYGFTLEIDDFGSGYSSLNTLKNVPAHVVKLDMKFLEDDDGSQRGGNIIESIVRMTKWLGMSVIAEGVEEKVQADFLKSIGCQYIQGYLYAKPMKVADYEELCKGVGKEERLLVLETVENLDNNLFWDPKSMDTLIFNSYVGGACIFEYHDGKTELLRVNDKYVQEFTGEKTDVNVYAYELNEFLDEENNDILINNIRRAIATERESSCEICTVGLYGVDKKNHIRSTVRMIARAGGRYLMYCTVSNITAQREAEQKRMEAVDQLQFLNKISHELLAQPDSNKAIDNTMQRLLDYFDGSRAYVFEFDYLKNVMNNSYEVCAVGINSEKDNLQEVPMEAAAFWLNAFEEKRYISIADVGSIGDSDGSRAEEKRILDEQGIKALIAVPIWRDGKIIGLIGIDDPHQQQNINRLAALGDYIAVMLTRRDLDAKIDSDSRSLASLMNDTPGGFVRMKLNADGSIIPIYFNEGFYKLVGMDYEELMELYGKDALTGVHPDDIKAVRDAVEYMISNGEAHSNKYRLRHGSGGYIWVVFFGRCIREESGEVFFNVYYNDATEQEKAETEQKELLDNLPCGAALYEYDGRTLSAIHLNKRYWQLVGREPVDYPNSSFLDAVHDDDRLMIKRELAAAIRKGCDVVCDIRIRHGGSEYRPFHIIGRIIPKEDGVYLIYATYIPISDEVMSYQEMLPIALATVIGSSSDIAFVKDKEYHYICCSPAFADLIGLADEADVIGKTDYDLIDKEYADKYRALEREITETKKARLDFEEILPIQSDCVRYGSTSKYPLLDAAGNVIGIYGVTRDITEYHTAYEQLKLVTDNIMGGIATYLCSPEGSKVSYFNDGFCELFGLSREEYEQIGTEEALPGIFDDDIPMLRQQFDALAKKDIAMDCIYRIMLRNGRQKWINLRATASDRRDDNFTVNAVLFDVTEQQNAIEQQRIREEENHLAIRHSGKTIVKYNVADKTLELLPEVAATFSMSSNLHNVPYEPVKQGLLAPESEKVYIDFYEGIINGQEEGTAVFQKKYGNDWLWIEGRYSTIFSDAGEPVSAIASFSNITEQLEKEAVFKKWRQSLQDKTEDSYTLFRCNISQNASFDVVEGSLLKIKFKDEQGTFDERTVEYAEQFVHEDDKEKYIAFLKSDALFANYHKGKRSDSIEYREKLHGGDVRWLRLMVDLVEHPNSTDVEAYLMYENIDDSKRAELLTIERAQTDPLTGILNRATFTEQVQCHMHDLQPHTKHAMLMLDVDGFKLVNDAFGHGAGDQVIIDIAKALRSVLRRGDLVGRLGGDEFVIFLKDIPNDGVAAAKAKQMCSLIRKSFSIEVQISGSVGIVMCPRDGTDFETLYKKVDAALYYVKGSGKDNYAFYHKDMNSEHFDMSDAEIDDVDTYNSGKKRRMLIVDDSRIDHAMLSNIFKDEFIIEKAKDGRSALISLHHYASAISVVLLDLMMPGMDGFEVLNKMQQSIELRSIPVIVVSGDEDHETSLKAIRSGATDFVTKPVDSELLRIRVYSAISKSENERLRAKNSFLELQNNETIRYKTVAERTGTAVIEYDCLKDTFTYDSHISHHIAGVYNARSLWQILVDDKVADAATVARMQQLVSSIAEDESQSSAAMEAELKTPEGDMHRFCMNVYEIEDESVLTAKLILTFNDCTVKARI